jgi:hypothetical protein
MKSRTILGWSSALCLSIGIAQAQEANSVEKINAQLKQMQESFEKQLREQQVQIDSLKKQLNAAQQATNPPAFVQATNTPIAAPAMPQFEAPASSWSPSQPITLARSGASYMNISFDTLLDAGWATRSDVSSELEQGHHDPLQRGFSLRNAEIALDGAVDPYFKGFANISFALDKDNETEVELEEAYLLSTALPANLQLKAGQFFTEFGRQNTQHPHQWAFADQPLVLTRFLGPDGLRNPGGQISWLAPTPFYFETFLGVFNGQGEQGFSFRNRGDEGVFSGRETFDRQLRGPGDLLFTPRIATSFDLTSQQTLLAGASAAFAPNDTGPDSRTQVYGLDLYWKWKSPHAHAGFPFVSLQTEALYRQFEAGPGLNSLPRETIGDYGFYAQALWGFKPHWVAGLRGEYLNGDKDPNNVGDPFRGERSRISPNLTWYPSEFSKIRLQYNYDNGENLGVDHAVWLQLEFLLGSHGAHKF